MKSLQTFGDLLDDATHGFQRGPGVVDQPLSKRLAFDEFGGNVEKFAFPRMQARPQHKHCGSLHASDAQHALQMARDVYTRRQEGVSLWVVPSAAITASDPGDKAEFFEPAGDKIYRHPTFYSIPDEVGHM